MVLSGFGSADEIAAAMEECCEQGSPRVEYHRADLAQPQEIENMFKFIFDKFGRSPDILVNNAGVYKVWYNNYTSHVSSLLSKLRKKHDVCYIVFETFAFCCYKFY